MPLPKPTPIPVDDRVAAEINRIEKCYELEPYLEQTGSIRFNGLYEKYDVRFLAFWGEGAADNMLIYTLNGDDVAVTAHWAIP